MISPELAELAGLFAADGCMQKTQRGGYICFWGNITEDREYYDAAIAVLFQKEFGVRPRLHEKRSNSVYGFYCCTPSIIQKFKDLNFQPGPKSHSVEIPLPILWGGDSIIQAAFIRGFFDGDGSLTFYKRPGPTYSGFNQTHHVYPRIEITSVSIKMIQQLHVLLLRLGIFGTINSKFPKKGGPSWCIYVRGKTMLERWMSLIGTNNPAQKSRYLLWKKQGYCPTHTTLAQRQNALA